MPERNCSRWSPALVVVILLAYATLVGLIVVLIVTADAHERFLTHPVEQPLHAPAPQGIEERVPDPLHRDADPEDPRRR